MTPRDLFLLFLRLFAIWYFLSALSSVLNYLAVLSYPVPSMSGAEVAALVAIQTGTMIAFAILFWLSPRVANAVYDAEPAEPHAERRLVARPRDLYQVGCTLLGIYLLVTAVQYAIFWLASPRRYFDPRPVEAAAYLMIGLVLVFASRPLSRWFAKSSGRTRELGNPQFSLRMAFVVVTLCAIIFALSTWLRYWI